jgi:beta-lactamase regulating signal transducer with metallopeptidase domain
MIAIEGVLQQPVVQAVGWTLVHFVWQGALVSALAAVLLALLRRSAADVRYVVATIALSVMVTLPMVTAVQVWRGSSSPWLSSGGSTPSSSGRTPLGASPKAGSSSSGQIPVLRDPGASTARAAGISSASWRSSLDVIRLEPWLPLLVIGWLGGVVLLTLRLISGWVWVQRLKTHGTRPAGDALRHAAVRLAKQLHIGRPVKLFESSLVDVPTVIGWMRPVVLLPISALSGLSPQQLEAVLAHELAHIRRHDYLVNLLQTLVETLLFYHPGVWWLSRQIRIERENCCDDLAVSLCGDPYTYARALADLEALRSGSGQLVLAVTGGSLLQRVRRLVGAPTHAGRAPGWLAGAIAILVMTAIAVGSARPEAAPQNVVAQAARSSPVVGNEPATTAEQTAVAADGNGQRAQDRLRAAAAQSKQREAALFELLARAAASLEQETGHATTPLLPSQPLVARADAAREAARAMAAQAGAAGDPLAEASALMSHASTAAMAGRALAGLDGSLASTASAALHPAAGIDLSSGQGKGSFSWSNNGEKLEVKYDGEIEFTDDDSDVKRLSPGGMLRIRDGSLIGGRTVEFNADGSGTITRRYFVGLLERPFEPEGRQWLHQALPRFIRQTGIGAPARVARFLKSGGVPAVLTEISRIEGSFGKRAYFKALLAQGTLDAATLRQVLAQASREIDSDFELASLLIGSADTFLKDESVRAAYFDAARSIESDFEMRRVFSSALKQGPVSSAVLAGILDASRQIDSDFEEASLLAQIAKLQPLDGTTRAPFFAALATVGSDFEHRRVLTALADRADQPVEVVVSMIESGGKIESDFEAASFLAHVAKQHSIDGPLRAPFFRAVETIESAFERGRVLKAVTARGNLPKETLVDVLRSARGMNSGFETSQVLQAVASGHTLTGEARDAYIDATEKLGDFEQGRALAALVRSERRK